MGAMLKETDATLTLKVAGGGPLGNLVALADSRGNVRGYVDHPEADLPLKPNGKLDVGGAVGKEGRLAVIRDFGNGKPYVGQVELLSGEIAEDITEYYAVSEQVPTVCALGVLVNKETGEAMLSGGLLIQVLPGGRRQGRLPAGGKRGKAGVHHHHAGQGHDGRGDLPQSPGRL